ncbi:MAG: VanZ family protein [Clostridia bacterium]|nr:VanZ family protein [Clostridia bacterium]
MGKRLRYFRIVRALALTALVCTILLTLLIFIESLLPAGASGAQSGFIGNAIQSIIGKGDEELDGAVPIFGSFAQFIRKAFGHFLLFAVLGVGLATCAFLMIKPRAIYPLVSLIIGFLIATLSEIFQLPIFTYGRAASWADVGIDTLGVACGVAFASVVLWLYVLIKRLANKEEYALLKSVFRSAYFPTIMKKGGTAMAVYDDEYIRM